MNRDEQIRRMQLAARVRTVAEGWCAPPEVVHDRAARYVELGLGEITRSVDVTGGVTIEDARLFYAAIREEKKVDKAVELLQMQRFEEEKAKETAQAEEIVEQVMDLRIADFVDNVGVRFIKRYNSDKAYVYLAQRVIQAKGHGTWYVTNKNSAMNDVMFESFLAQDGGFEDFTVVYGLAYGDEDMPLTSTFKGAPVSRTFGPAEPGEE